MAHTRKNAIKPYDPKFCYNEKKCRDENIVWNQYWEMMKKYYWINDNGEQTWDMSAYEWVTYIHPFGYTICFFSFIEKGREKDVVDIDSTRPFEGDIFFLLSFLMKKIKFWRVILNLIEHLKTNGLWMNIY